VADVELNDVHDVLKDANQFVWIGLHEPSEEVLSTVQQEFGLHDLAVEDAHNAHQRPKVELYGDSIFIVLRTAHIARDRNTEFGETHFFIGPTSLLLFDTARAFLMRKCVIVAKAHPTC
jgi:magnesium transporter